MKPVTKIIALVAGGWLLSAAIATATAQTPPQLSLQTTTAPQDAALFDLRIDDTTVAYGTASGITAGPYVENVGSHTVTTSADLSKYAVAFGGDCSDDGHGSGTVALAMGDRKTCIITHLGPPVLAVDFFGQVSGPPSPGDAGNFNVQVDGHTVLADANIYANSGPVYSQIAPDGTAHHVSVIQGTGTDLANYTIFFGTDCAPDGTVPPAAQGQTKVCTIQALPPYAFLFFLIDTGDDDLRSDSAAMVTVQTTNQPDQVQTFTLKGKDEAAWGNNTEHIKSFPLSHLMQPADFGPVVIHLIQGTSGAETPDNWHIRQIKAWAVRSPDTGLTALDTGSCIFIATYSPNAALTGSQPSLLLDPDDPGCAAIATPPLRTPSFSPVEGFYSCPLTANIASAKWTFFTTDGSRPTGRSSPLIGPLPVTQNETIRAISLTPDGVRSPVAGAQYSCKQPSPPPVCPVGLHCCGDVVRGSCVPGCVSNSTSCRPRCPAVPAGLECCGSALPTGQCEKACIRSPPQECN